MLSLLTAAALSVTPALPIVGDDNWLADFDEAAKLARAEGKDLLVDFTGSDWCGWCIKLHEEVFQYDAFLDAAKEKYVLVALDFPNGEEAKAAVPNPERNDELQEKYEIQGFPTILIMNPDGEVFAEMGYAEGGPEAYVASMTEKVTAGKEMLAGASALVERFDAAEGDARIAVMGEAIAMLEKAAAAETTIGWDRVAPIAREALALDAEAHKDLRFSALGALLGGSPDQELIDMAYTMDADNSAGMYEQGLMAQMGQVEDDVTATALTERLKTFAGGMVAKDTTAVAEMFGTAAMWNEQFLEDHETAVMLATHALGMDAELDEEFAGMLRELAGAVVEEPVNQG